MVKEQATAMGSDPVDDYLSSLLSGSGEVTGQQVNWNDLLHDAVAPHCLQDALDACTLVPGFAPLRLLQPGEGNYPARRTQLFQILHHVSELPDSRLKRCMLMRAGPMAEEAGFYV